ncbi:hypothetical protein CR513_38863, partial [Mucuna pruriens]
MAEFCSSVWATLFEEACNTDNHSKKEKLEKIAKKKNTAKDYGEERKASNQENPFNFPKLKSLKQQKRI